MTYPEAIRRLVERGWIKFPDPAVKPAPKPRGRPPIEKPAFLSVSDYDDQRKAREERLAARREKNRANGKLGAIERWGT